MDQEQLDALANAALEELARRNYGDFFYLSHGKQWDLLRHQKYITDRLQIYCNYRDISSLLFNETSR